MCEFYMQFEGSESPARSKGRQLWSCGQNWSQDAEVQEYTGGVSEVGEMAQ